MRSIVWLGIALSLVQVLKLSLERARPGMPPGTMDGASFPSGHIANAALCVGAALRIGAGLRGWRSVLRCIVLLAGVFFVAAIAFSSLYLGRHWATDVVGSVLLGGWFWAVVDDVRRPVLGWRRGAPTRANLASGPPTLAVYRLAIEEVARICGWPRGWWSRRIAFCARQRFGTSSRWVVGSSQ